MTYQQLALGYEPRQAELSVDYRDRLLCLLGEDLDFHDAPSGNMSHNFHPFPAKFPPQLPRRFITQLTEPGDLVLDPMAGSGTTVVEAFMSGRRGLGTDIDPLALLLTQVKTTPLSARQALSEGMRLALAVEKTLEANPQGVADRFEKHFDADTKQFIDYWFPVSSHLELYALAEAIGNIGDSSLAHFLQLTLSATIITKSAGVTLARDLAHTRPHRVELERAKSPLAEFRKRLQRNAAGLRALHQAEGTAQVVNANAQHLALGKDTADLIVTSPPYASNAIDYMRAHKFSLIWLGHPIGELGQKRREYIGAEATAGLDLPTLPDATEGIIAEIGGQDSKKALVLRRYYSEMTDTLAEMLRVLRPGKAAILVVGTSRMRGIDIRVDTCLAEIGTSVGFDLGGIAVRQLDRDRRMMPARWKSDVPSQIEQRMHEEFVIALLKPRESRA